MCCTQVQTKVDVILHFFEKLVLTTLKPLVHFLYTTIQNSLIQPTG